MITEDDKIDFIDLWYDEPKPLWSSEVDGYAYAGFLENPVLDSNATRVRANVIQMYRGTLRGSVVLQMDNYWGPGLRRRMCAYPRALFFASNGHPPDWVPYVCIPNGWFPVEDGACGPVVSIFMQKEFFLDLKNTTEADGLLKVPLESFLEYCGFAPQ